MCNCMETFFPDEKPIYEDKKMTIEFGRIMQNVHGSDTVYHGYGLNLYHQNKPDQAFKFNYCPWCGAKYES